MNPNKAGSVAASSFFVHRRLWRRLALVALSCCSQPMQLKKTPPNALWEVVHNVCVPGQSEHHDPKPCLQVDLNGGIESGFAILRDPRGGTQILLIPTTRISGIESPIVRGPSAPNYFASAWEVRTYINEALHLTLPRDDIGLAINSTVSRSQDQLTFTFLAFVPTSGRHYTRMRGGLGTIGPHSMSHFSGTIIEQCGYQASTLAHTTHSVFWKRDCLVQR
jgi:hypothetical protein